MQPNVALLLDRKYDVSCGGEDHLVRSFPILASAWCAANMLATCNVHAADWLQFGYDAAHSGVNPQETAITRDNVATLVELANVPVPDYVYGAPVLLSGVATAVGQRDVLFLSTQGGSLLALDARDGAVLWSQQPSGTGHQTAGSPAIDGNRQFVYAYGLDGKVHKYAVGDGAESTDQGWPQLVTLKPTVEHGAASLAIGDTRDGESYLYAVVDGYVGDGGDYQGHLTTINLRTGAQTVFNTLCSDVATHFIENGQPGVTDCGSAQSGIWGRPGSTFDAATGRVYIATGNGPYDANFGGFDWGDSVIALPADGTGSGGLPLDSYTPTNYEDLYLYDVDLGSSSLTLIGDVPGNAAGRLGMIMGKDGYLRLLSLDDMSGAGGPRHVGGELQMVGGGFSKCNTPQPAIWHAGDGTVWMYVIGPDLRAYQVVADAGGRPEIQARWGGFGETTPVVANGIVFTWGGSLYATDAMSGDVLWQSPQELNVFWQSPIVVDGRIYIAAFDGLHIYGLDRVFADGFDSNGSETGRFVHAAHPSRSEGEGSSAPFPSPDVI